jgi:outer membrane receptor for ferrienterochelin and colicin
VIDITTKTGADLQGATAGVYGGSFGTIRPFYNIGGTTGKLDYFGSFSYDQNNLGIENPTSSANALHDHTTQYNGFGGLIYRIDDHNKITLFVGASNQQFQIPDIGGQPSLFAAAGAPNIPSSALNENQNEQRYFGVLAYDLDLGRLTIRPSLFESYNRILYTPDYVGDLIYQGTAGRTLNQLSSAGGEIDATYALTANHKLGFGGRLSFDGYNRADSVVVFPADANGNQTSNTPFQINDTDRRQGRIYSFYLQDQWSATDRLTINYGVRYDNYYGYSSADQVSPRVNAVYRAPRKIRFHDATAMRSTRMANSRRG